MQIRVLGAAAGNPTPNGNDDMPSVFVFANGRCARHDLCDNQRSELRIHPPQQQDETRTVETPHAVIEPHLSAQQSSQLSDEFVRQVPLPVIAKLPKAFQGDYRQGDRFTTAVRFPQRPFRGGQERRTRA